MPINKAANGRHVVRVERESVVEIPGDSGRVLGQTYYYGLYFHDDEVAQAWAMETFERSPGRGSSRNRQNRSAALPTRTLFFSSANTSSNF